MIIMALTQEQINTYDQEIGQTGRNGNLIQLTTAELSFLQEKSNGNKFFKSLAEKANRYGSLFVSQFRYVWKEMNHPSKSFAQEAKESQFDEQIIAGFVPKQNVTITVKILYTREHSQTVQRNWDYHVQTSTVFCGISNGVKVSFFAGKKTSDVNIGGIYKISARVKSYNENYGLSINYIKKIEKIN